MTYFSDIENRYFTDDLDLALEKPISAVEAVPIRKNAAPGTDPGGLLTSKIVGITANPMQSQVEALQASIRSGASKVELGFMGVQKGSERSPTPESMSKEEREMIYQLAKINEVETTVHAAPSASNLSGFNPRANSFNESAREDALNEIRRAVDFAADASTGGAVVLHWDEWQRPIETTYGLKDQNNMFQGHRGEFIKKEDEQGNREYGPSEIFFVDTETDKVQALRRDIEFTEPVIESIDVEKDNLGDEYLKYNYKKSGSGNGISETEKMNYDKIIELETKMNEDKNFEKYQRFADNKFEQLRKKWEEIKSMPTDTELQKQQKNDAIFFFHFLRKQTDRAYEHHLSADSMYRYHQNMRLNDPKQTEEDEQRRVMAWTAFQEQLNKIEKMKPIEDYATQKAADTVAEAALYAWQRSQGNKQLSRNLYIAPESFAPQSYGSHPDEMMQMIKDSREIMAEKLLNANAAKTKEEAQKEAAKYIRATLDIGHLNMWRRHLKKKEGESIEEYNKRFDKWAIDKSTEMAEKGFLGHAHMSDNFGFGDEHLTIGQGNAPIKEFVEALRNTGKVDDFIVEVGSFNANTAQRDAWSHLGISMGGGKYFEKSDFRSPGYFSQVRYSYAGQARKPSYVYGNYLPKVGSEKWQGWAPWTGSQI